MRTLLVLMIAFGCKSSERKAVPPPRVSTLPPLPAAATATIDPTTATEFPKEQPAIVVWQGGGEPPQTNLGIRVWLDGTVRFRCNRRGSLPRERVAAMLDTLDRAGWLPATPATPPTAPSSTCITTSVQVSRADRSTRRNSACSTIPDDISDAVQFVQAVVGPDPCP